MKQTWVMDAKIENAEKTLDNHNEMFDKRPEGSRYIKGKPKEHCPCMFVGIYFEDPTAN